MVLRVNVGTPSVGASSSAFSQRCDPALSRCALSRCCDPAHSLPHVPSRLLSELLLLLLPLLLVLLLLLPLLLVLLLLLPLLLLLLLFFFFFTLLFFFFFCCSSSSSPPPPSSSSSSRCSFGPLLWCAARLRTSSMAATAPDAMAATKLNGRDDGDVTTNVFVAFAVAVASH